jgi:hypothetical protein
MPISRRDLLKKMLKRIKATSQAIPQPRNCRATFTARFQPEWLFEWAAHLEQIVRRCLPGINARFAVSHESTATYVANRENV